MVIFSTPLQESFTHACGLLPYFLETSLHAGPAPAGQDFNSPWALTRTHIAGLLEAGTGHLGLSCPLYLLALKFPLRVTPRLVREGVQLVRGRG